MVARTLLIILMAADYLTGILVSLKEKKGISSNISFSLGFT
ncbi:phage holin family protein [Paenibacillus sp. GCM10027626]